MKSIWIKILVLVITNVSFAGNSVGQDCNLKFDFRTEYDDFGGKIIIKYINGQGDFTFKLFDWQDGVNDFINQNYKASFNSNEEFLVFDNLPASTYTIQVFTPQGCQTSIGGIEKIKVGLKNESDESK